MSDIDNIIRDFQGNPNPSPEALPAPKIAPTPITEDMGGAKAEEARRVEPISDPVGKRRKQGSFRVVTHGVDKAVYFQSPSNETIKVGSSQMESAGELLKTLGRHSKTTDSYDVSKDLADAVSNSDLSFLDYTGKLFKQGRTELYTGTNMTQAVRGNRSFASADAENRILERGAINTEWPTKPLKEDYAAGLVARTAWLYSNAVKMTPYIFGGLTSAAKNGLILAGATEGMAILAGGPVGAVAGVPVAAVMGSVGFAYGIIMYASEIEGGHLATEMYRNGHNESAIRVAAPIGGAIIGAIEASGLRGLMPGAIAKEVGKVMTSKFMKKALANKVVKYAALPMTGEGATEAVQEKVGQMVRIISADIEKNPEIFFESKETMRNRVKWAGITGFAMGGFFGVAGGVLSSAVPSGKAKLNLKNIKTEILENDGKLPAAKTIEKRILAEDEGALKALDSINELDQKSPEARIEHFEHGQKNANQSTKDAVFAKQKAVDLQLDEMMGEGRVFNEDTFSDLPVEEQNAFIPLIEEKANLNKIVEGMKDTASEAKRPVNKVEDKKATAGENLRAKIKGILAKVKDAEVVARVKKLDSDLKGVLASIKNLSITRKALVRADISTKALDNQLKKMRNQEDVIHSQLAAILTTEEENVKLRETEAIETTPRTVDSLVKLLEEAAEEAVKASEKTGLAALFASKKEGAKAVKAAEKAGDKKAKAAYKAAKREVLVKRAGFIKEVGFSEALSDADLKKVVGPRNIGLMSNLEFKKFLDEVRIKAKVAAERRQALGKLVKLMSDKEFKHAANLRKFNELPVVAKMTADQINEFIGMLRGFEQGDNFWSPKAIAAIDRTKWQGAKTKREVLELAAKEYGIPVEDILSVDVGPLDRVKFDYWLSKSNPLYQIALEELKTAKARAQMKWTLFRGNLFTLGKKALASRNIKLDTWEKVLRKISSIQPEVMAYIETPNENKMEAAKSLTQEELDFANYWIEFASSVHDYLVRVQALQSKFAEGGYVFHSKRGLPELAVDVLRGSTDMKAAVSEVLTGWREASSNFSVVDSQHNILSKEKFFKQSLFRSGNLTPSQSMIEVMDSYARQFYSKVAFDEAIPTIETVLMSMTPAKGLEVDKIRLTNLKHFMKQMLNTKKGQRIDWSGTIPQGGIIDAGLKLGTNLMGINYIAWNYKLQLASVVGEQIPVYMLLGARGRLLANARRITAKGQRIIAKYRHFTGDSAIDTLLQPGKSVGDYVKLTQYGIFQQSRALVMQELLLGNMTKAEFASETISDKRLGNINTEAGRWLDVADSKSVFGSTSLGTEVNQFKSWAFPVARTIGEDLLALAKAVGTLDGNKISKQQLVELYRLMILTAVVTYVYGAVGTPEENKEGGAWTMKGIALRELGTAGNAVQIAMSGGAGVLSGFLTRLAMNLFMLTTDTDYARGPRKGENKGKVGLQRQFTPAGIKQFRGKKKSKRRASID